jgi:hypothetical protein
MATDARFRDTLKTLLVALGSPEPARRQKARQTIRDTLAANQKSWNDLLATLGIEVYHGKVILYAPSNVLRGHNGPSLDDGYLARFTLGPKSVEKVEVLPIVGKGQPEGHTGPYDSKLFQPTLMQGADAQRLLENLRSRSAALDTTMAIDGEKGVITVSQTSR